MTIVLLDYGAYDIATCGRNTVNLREEQISCI